MSMFPDLEYMKTLVSGLRTRLEGIEKKIPEISKAVPTKISDLVNDSDFTQKEIVYDIRNGSSGLVYWFNIDDNSQRIMSFVEAEELYRKWLSGNVSIMAMARNDLSNGGAESFYHVIGMRKEAANSGGDIGDIYDIGFSVVSAGRGEFVSNVNREQT